MHIQPMAGTLWWRSTNSVNCTEEELASVLERALLIQQYPIDDNMSIDTAVGVRIGETK